MGESAIQKKIRLEIERRGGFVLKQQASIYSTNGAPDLVCCYRGKFLAIEVKQPGEEPRKIQLHRQKQIRKSGGICEVCDCVEDVIVLLDHEDYWRTR